jgi:pimeloyl-ACP methyl ester carboxylesterase
MTHSMSGPYGWKLLEQYGDHVAKIVAVAPGPPGNIQAAATIASETPAKLEVRPPHEIGHLCCARPTPRGPPGGDPLDSLIPPRRLWSWTTARAGRRVIVTQGGGIPCLRHPVLAAMATPWLGATRVQARG